MLVIDNRLLEPNGEADIIEDFNRTLNMIDNVDPEVHTQLDFNCTLSEGIITGILDSTIPKYEMKKNTEYIIHLVLPITTISGDLDNDYTIVLKDKDGNDINLNCIYQTDMTKTSTVGNLCELQNFNSSTGYSWHFQGFYREIDENKIIYIDNITRPSVNAMTGEDLYKNVVNKTLRGGSVVIVTDDYTNDTNTYTKGHQYLITSEWVSDDLIIDTKDITIGGA